MDESFTDPERAARVRAAAPAVDALFAEALGELGAPGIAYGVALDGELLHSGGCGVRDLESGSAPDADTAFRICSMTKSFIAMVVLSLRDEGRLDIDAPLGEIAADLRRARRGRAGRAARHGAPAADDGRRTAAGRPLGGSPDGRRQRLGEQRAVRARRDALARAGHGLRVLQLRLGGARPGHRGRHRTAPPGRRARARPRAARPALDGLERRRSPAAAGRDGVLPGRRRLHGRGAAGRRRLLLGARRPLQQRARPGALERGVPGRRAAARCARAGAREPRDAARDAARAQRLRARGSSGRRWPSRRASWPAATATA